MDSVPTLSYIVNLCSAVKRSLFSFRSSINNHFCLSSGRAPPPRRECLRLVAYSGLHYKLLLKLTAHNSTASSGRPTFASFVLHRVIAKLAAATPEFEAASVVSWCRQAAECELPKCLPENMADQLWNYYKMPRSRSQTEYAADAMSQLAASCNGRMALVSCGACEALVDVMLQNKVYTVHGCLDESREGSYCMRRKCSCDERSCYSHRSYVCAALALGACAEGAFRLHRAGWNANWYVVACRLQTHIFDNKISDWVEYGIIPELKRHALSVPPVIVHFKEYPCVMTALFRTCRCPPCHCSLLQSRCPLNDPELMKILTACPGDGQAADCSIHDVRAYGRIMRADTWMSTHIKRDDDNDKASDTLNVL